jgi:hypothetical protein
MNATLFTLTLTGMLTISGCGSSSSTSSDTQGDARFRVTFNSQWSANAFPTQYPSGAHWSPLVGTVHNEQVIFWAPNDQPATIGIESMAETGATSLFNNEIQVAKEAGYSQGRIQASGITGTGSTSIEFSTSTAYPLLTLVSMIAPSPDWFTGVSGLSLQDDQGDWIESQALDLKLYDAGTDLGLSFGSSNSESNEQNLAITLLSSDPMYSDFNQGVHLNSGQHVGTLVIEKL